MTQRFFVYAILLAGSSAVSGNVKNQDLELAEDGLFKYEMTLSSEKKRSYLRLIDDRKQDGLRALREAKQMSYLIPDLDTRKIVRNAITSAVTAMLAKGVAVRAIIVALGALGETAGQYYDNYCAIKEKLAYAKYCSEVIESLKKEMLRLEHSPHVIE